MSRKSAERVPVAPPLDAVLKSLPAGENIVAHELVDNGPAVIFAIRRPG